MRRGRSEIRRFAALAAAVFLPSSAAAMVNAETEKGSANLRGAVDLGAAFSANNGPRLLYPEGSDGMGSETFRLLLNAAAGGWLKVDVHAYENLTGQTAVNAVFYGTGGADYRYDNLEHTWGSGKVRGSLVLDQLQFMFIAGPVDITVGRQPIGLANNFLFTPNDVFNPFAVGTPDRAFRPGVDALRLDWRVAGLARITALGVVGYEDDGVPSWDRSAVLLKGSVNAAGFDWSAFGGKVAGRYLAGVAISGEAGPVGLRCEGNASMPQDAPEKGHVQFAAGLDHKWRNSLHLAAEYYYHGNGTMDPWRYVARFINQDLVADPYVGMHYVGVSLSGEAMPILNLQATVLANLTDPSAYFIPAIIFNAASEVDLLIFGAIPAGKAAGTSSGGLPKIKSEFGTYPLTLSVLARIFF
jgi:hypothetical protein